MIYFCMLCHTIQIAHPASILLHEPKYYFKKSLGQHFLRDENIRKKIVAALQEYPFKQLLEVGPGGGALTKYLLEIEE